MKAPTISVAIAVFTITIGSLRAADRQWSLTVLGVANDPRVRPAVFRAPTTRFFSLTDDDRRALAKRFR